MGLRGRQNLGLLIPSRVAPVPRIDGGLQGPSVLGRSPSSAQSQVEEVDAPGREEHCSDSPSLGSGTVCMFLRGHLKQTTAKDTSQEAFIPGHLRPCERPGSFSRAPGPFLSTVKCNLNQDPESLTLSTWGIIESDPSCKPTVSVPILSPEWDRERIIES